MCGRTQWLCLFDDVEAIVQTGNLEHAFPMRARAHDADRTAQFCQRSQDVRRRRLRRKKIEYHEIGVVRFCYGSFYRAKRRGYVLTAELYDGDSYA